MTLERASGPASAAPPTMARAGATAVRLSASAARLRADPFDIVFPATPVVPGPRSGARNP